MYPIPFGTVPASGRPDMRFRFRHFNSRPPVRSLVHTYGHRCFHSRAHTQTINIADRTSYLVTLQAADEYHVICVICVVTRNPCSLLDSLLTKRLLQRGRERTSQTRQTDKAPATNRQIANKALHHLIV